MLMAQLCGCHACRLHTKHDCDLQAYTSYKVCTTTDAEQFRTRQPEVIRRYRDFCWLHDRLTEQHRGTPAWYKSQ